mmetsp:Transcript_878/g.2740  ORF Transcript_878/g.2740 Transcript_878/m.2740 type:complete len:319 (-) Transcript_878:1158-2114(-)
MSSLDNLPLSLVMVILFFWPVDLSSADTFKIPFASMSKQTLICGTPLGAGGMPCNSNLPNKLLSLVRERSPSKTWINTPGWLSEYVENTCSFLVGIVVFLGINTVMTPPTVSKPIDNGVTSNNNKSWTFSFPSPDKMAAWTAAPYATASSGCTDLFNGLPSKYSVKISWTLGTRVEPPTKTISFTNDLSLPASAKTLLTASKHLWKVASFTLLNSSLEMVMFTSCSPTKHSNLADCVMDNSLLAFSHAVLNLRLDLSSLKMESAFGYVFWTCAIKDSSKSSPPKWVSPAVANTSKTPSCKCNKETSKVPPPKSKTKIV